MPNVRTFNEKEKLLSTQITIFFGSSTHVQFVGGLSVNIKN
jgi:hypothetical protein